MAVQKRANFASTSHLRRLWARTSLHPLFVFNTPASSDQISISFSGVSPNTFVLSFFRWPWVHRRCVRCPRFIPAFFRHVCHILPGDGLFGGLPSFRHESAAPSLRPESCRPSPFPRASLRELAQKPGGCILTKEWLLREVGEGEKQVGIRRG